MATTYTWKITDLQVKDVNENRPKTVIQTFWEKHGTDENGNTGFFAGATPFTVDPTDDSGPFIPFEQLTEADVLLWVQSQINSTYEEHINNRIQKNIEENSEIVRYVDPPWI